LRPHNEARVTNLTQRALSPKPPGHGAHRGHSSRRSG